MSQGQTPAETKAQMLQAMEKKMNHMRNNLKLSKEQLAAFEAQLRQLRESNSDALQAVSDIKKLQHDLEALDE